MKIDEMIEVLQAAKRGEKIEVREGGSWYEHLDGAWNFDAKDYRIAPKKERGLVEQLRAWGASPGNVIQRAADRIEQLEMDSITSMVNVTTDELLAELKRRTT